MSNVFLTLQMTGTVKRQHNVARNPHWENPALIPSQLYLHFPLSPLFHPRDSLTLNYDSNRLLPPSLTLSPAFYVLSVYRCPRISRTNLFETWFSSKHAIELTRPASRRNNFRRIISKLRDQPWLRGIEIPVEENREKCWIYSENAGGRLRQRDGVDFGQRSRGLVHPWRMQKFGDELQRKCSLPSSCWLDKIAAIAAFHAGNSKEISFLIGDRFYDIHFIYFKIKKELKRECQYH